MARVLGNIGLFALLLIAPFCAYGAMISVVGGGEPEILASSHAQDFFDELKGETRTYHVSSAHPWTLRIRLAVPRYTNGEGRYSALVIDESRGTIAATLEPGTFPWERVADPLTHAAYLSGPRLEKELAPGTYIIIVGNAANQGKYMLEIGGDGRHSVSELWGTLLLMPHVYPSFFGQPLLFFALSPLGLVGVLILLSGALCAAFILLWLWRRLPARRTRWMFGWILFFGLIYALLQLCAALASHLLPTVISASRHLGSLSAEPNITERTTSVNDAYVPVLHVVDGDTVDVLREGVNVRVRLIGVNTPETVDPRRPVQCFGKEASAKMSALLSLGSVRLEMDSSQGEYDKYHRLLAYLYTQDGTFVNQALIADGYAYEYTYRTPYRYQQEFKAAEQHARASGLGLWAKGVCAQ